jgi:hypothetical protein
MNQSLHAGGDPITLRLIEQIHATPHRLVFEFSGAGSLALYWLHAVGGSSRTVIEAGDRYATTSMADLLGFTPQASVSMPVARAMGARALQRAKRLASDQPALLGVGLTAAIATDRAKRGEHRACLAVWSGDHCATYRLLLEKGARDRFQEEALIGRLVVGGVARACGLTAPALELLPSDSLIENRLDACSAVPRLLRGELRWLRVEPDGTQAIEPTVRGGLLSGSFNPLHVGHERLVQAAAEFLGFTVGFELPVRNADKPALDWLEVERRAAQFAGGPPLVLSAAPLFEEKAALFPGCVFVVGIDTALRLLDPKYYAGEAGRDRSLQMIRDAGCSFLVAGRATGGTYQELDTGSLPAAAKGLLRRLPESAFRIDISSTELRAGS